MSKDTISWQTILRIEGNRAETDNERMIFMSVKADNTCCLDKTGRTGFWSKDDE
jgi:hypothetical protein